MSKIHNMTRYVGQPGSEEFSLPAGWKLQDVFMISNHLSVEETNSFPGAEAKMLYVLVPEDEVVASVRRGRPPVQE
jgi:hypothetical protein